MPVSIIFWFFGPALGAASVFASLYLLDVDLTSSSGYKAGLSSLFFVAATICASACGDAFELALLLRTDRVDARGGRAAAGLLLNLLVCLGPIVALGKLTVQSARAGWQPAWAHVSLAISSLVVALVIGASFKVVLERLKQDERRKLP